MGEAFDTERFEQSTYNLFIGLDRLITVDFDYYFHLVRVDMRGMLMSRLKNVLKATAVNMVEELTRNKGHEAPAIAAFIAGGFFNVYIEWHYNANSLSLEEAAKIASTMVGACLKSLPTS